MEPHIHPDLLTESYTFQLPKVHIATHPMAPRDHCKLLVYNRATNEIIHTYFYNILSFIPQNCGIILNDTRVIKARLFGNKATSGAIELVVNTPLSETTINVLIRGKVKVDTKIIFDHHLTATVKFLHEDGTRDVEFFHHEAIITFSELIPILEKIGHIPLPPYMEREDDECDMSDYQTCFGIHDGSVAAPTASLHFTSELIDEIKSYLPVESLTLHVGAGTFKPVDVKTITDHPMHYERYDIPHEALQLIQSDKPLLAVGTTATRTVEYFWRTHEKSGACNLFLHPHNPPQRITHLLTNFHLPASTLIMLVSSFIGREKTLELYEVAIKENYRFYSYGDAMLIL